MKTARASGYDTITKAAYRTPAFTNNQQLFKHTRSSKHHPLFRIEDNISGLPDRTK